MDVYYASDGGLFQLERHLEEYEALDALYEDISAVTNIPVANVLLFMDDERELKQDVLEEAWNQAGPSSFPMAPRSKIYLFNRDTFWQDAEQWAVQLQEDVQLPPPLDLSSLAHVQHPFLVAHDHLSHLQSLYEAQSRALQIAYANLSHHLQPLIQTYQEFASRAEPQLKTEEELIRGAKVDMALLPKMVVNPALIKRKGKEAESDEKTKTLGDYVNRRKMEQVRDSCRTAHEDHVERYNFLANQLDELAIQAETENRAFEEKSAEIGREFQEGLARLEIALNQLTQLLGSGAEGLHQELDQAMRDDLLALTGVKNEFTLDIHIHLGQVARFESRITELVRPMRQLDTDLKAKVAFPHLDRLHHLPFAYATAVAEVVRRKEYGRLLIEWTTRLAQTLSRFTSTEAKRREQVQVELISQLPFEVILSEGAKPRVDFSVVTGAETLGAVNSTPDEVEKLVQWVEGLKNDEEVLAAMEEGDEDHLEGLQASIETLIGRVDFASDELDRMIERSGESNRSSSNSRTLLQLSSQLRLANKEREEQEKRVAEIHQTHQAQLRDLEDQHQQRAATLQTRQAELQDELVRLRTDLSEEMLARQALSAELEERAREQDDRTRNVEDQTELITTLQAEIAQEKDRAIDLGVRLQEALLDVDGLKSAEQTLIAQLQELQEERTRSLQSLGEAQLSTHNLESQLAGVRAELEATSKQLVKAQWDRDTALRNQSAEAERMMRDHIAEADGDRAVLEHQNLTLTKQLDDFKVEMNEKLAAARNTAIRQADGLKAELSFTKAQLREAQRKETVLSDELAMAKDTAMAMSQKEIHQSDVARDAVALSSKYLETCQRLLNAINMSTTISGSMQNNRSRSPPQTQNAASAALSMSSKDEMRESVLVRSLATAQGFDLVGFAEAVTRTIGLVKKWSKSCRQFRDLARNKISFANFTKGDLALFLPTRNAAARSWAAFNISAPHNFLKVTDAMQEQIKTREWIIARIVKTEEAIASGGDNISNPFGLADGLRYYTHHVEEYNPTSIRSPRRSTSSYAGHSAERDMTVSQMMASTSRSVGLEQTPGVDSVGIASPPRVQAPGQGRPRSQSGYFPPMSSMTENGRQEQSTSTSDSPDPEEFAGPPETPRPAIAIFDKVQQTEPDDEETSTSQESTIPPPSSPAASGAPLSPTPAPAQPIPPRVISHTRMSSKTSIAASPPSREPSLTPGHAFASSLVRPSSVASSASSYPKGLGLPGSKAAPAPAMAVTTSSGGGGTGEEDGGQLPKRILRKTSSIMSFSQSPDGGEGASTSGGTKSSPLASTGIGPEGSGMLPRSTTEGHEIASTTSATPNDSAGSFATLGTGTAGKLIRGFSIGRRRPSSGAATITPGTGGAGAGAGTGEKPSAMDMLRRFENGGA
nr:uncharacterized protein CI109_002633 [Kwoniella shandongensis]KAA5528876.1 hypothetical protein CI109_002633 [Kwoniella shandongensis]